jgi:hypothetical protein
MRAYLATAANHDRRPLDVLTELTGGTVRIPAMTRTVTLVPAAVTSPFIAVKGSLRFSH